MPNKRISGESRRGRSRFNRTTRLCFIVFLFTLFFPGLWAQPKQTANKKQLEHVYAMGKAAFYSILEENIDYLPLNEKDRTFLQHENGKKKGLFEHLMNFYYYLQDISFKDEKTFLSDFLRISRSLASEFIESIPLPSLEDGYSSLKPLLISSGYFFKRTSPQFRKFLRPLGKKVKDQRAFRDLQVKQAQSLSKGENIKIAIIDSGVDPTIKEIKGRIKKYKNLLDGSMPFADKGSFPFDWNGHGTAVTSLIHQIAPKAELLIIKFYDSERMKQATPSRWTAYLAAAGMIWAAQNGADIINLSAAFFQDLWPIRQASKYCWERNITIVTAMGNAYNPEDASKIYFPAQYPWTIAVGGTARSEGQMKVWEYSGQGEYVDFVAPAMDLWVDFPSYLEAKMEVQTLNGNSLATALASGASALILSAMEKMTLADHKVQPGELCEKVRSIFKATASNDKLGFSLPNPFSGYGQIEIHKAVLLALSEKGSKRSEDVLTSMQHLFRWNAFSSKLSK
jgi:subtilisin family serine protease